MPLAFQPDESRRGRAGWGAGGGPDRWGMLP